MSANINNGINNQLKKLVTQDGVSIEEAAELLGLDVEMCQLALMSMTEREIDCEKLIEENKVACIQALISIGLDENIDNVSARVGALKIIVERKGALPEIAANKLDELYKRMKNVTSRYDEEQKTLSNQTTVVVENTNITKTNDFDSKFARAKEKELCHTK
jgi:predicted HTH domain antitoxin